MRDGWSLPDRARFGQMPQWAIDEPEVTWSEGTIIDAFFELSSCRVFSDHCMGPIPWTAIASYADRLRLPPDILMGWTRAVRVLDDAYLEWNLSQQRPRGTVESGKVTERGAIAANGTNRG